MPMKDLHPLLLVQIEDHFKVVEPSSSLMNLLYAVSSTYYKAELTAGARPSGPDGAPAPSVTARPRPNPIARGLRE